MIWKYHFFFLLAYWHLKYFPRPYKERQLPLLSSLLYENDWLNNNSFALHKPNCHRVHFLIFNQQPYSYSRIKQGELQVFPDPIYFTCKKADTSIGEIRVVHSELVAKPRPEFRPRSSRNCDTKGQPFPLWMSNKHWNSKSHAPSPHTRSQEWAKAGKTAYKVLVLLRISEFSPWLL